MIFARGGAKMKKLIVLAMLLGAVWAGRVCAQPGYCDCYGGSGKNGDHWQLLDYQGSPLEDGDWAYAAWTGPDGKIDPPDMNGNPTGDDVLLPISGGRIEYNTFFFTVATWQEGSVDEQDNPRHPVEGELFYCRIFDGPEGSIGPENYYGDSQTHPVVWKMGDQLFCLFPGDPGGGHTNTPVPGGGSAEAASIEHAPQAFDLDLIYPNILNPAVMVEYALSQNAHVILKVYDLTGTEVATLVDAHQEAGFHTVRWDAADLPSGVYFCRMQAGNFSKTVKMIHLR